MIMKIVEVTGTSVEKCEEMDAGPCRDDHLHGDVLRLPAAKRRWAASKVRSTNSTPQRTAG